MIIIILIIIIITIIIIIIIMCLTLLQTHHHTFRYTKQRSMIKFKPRIKFIEPFCIPFLHLTILRVIWQHSSDCSYGSNPEQAILKPEWWGRKYQQKGIKFMGDAYKDGREMRLCTTSLSTFFHKYLWFCSTKGGLNPNHSILNEPTFLSHSC